MRISSISSLEEFGLPIENLFVTDGIIVVTAEDKLVAIGNKLVTDGNREKAIMYKR